MASHGVNWVLRSHVRFGDLDFIITTKGELAQAPVVIQPLHSVGLDAITEALEELQLPRRPMPPGVASSSTSTTVGWSVSSASS